MPPIYLAEGEQRLLRAPGMVRFSIGSLHLLKAIQPPHGYTKDALLLKALTTGRTDLWLFYPNQRAEHRSVIIKSTSKLDLPVPIQSVLQGLMETEILVMGSGIVLHGTITTEDELRRITLASEAFPKDIVNTTIPSDDLLRRGKQALERWIKDKNLRLEKIGTTLWIRGDHHLSKEGEVQLRIDARREYPGVRFDLTQLSTIYFRVFLVEISRNHIQSLGLSWPHPIDIHNIDLTLRALEGKGHARVLSNPELAVRVPGEAELFSGGELPIRNRTTKFSSSTSWRNYGLTLKLKVLEASSTSVRLEVFTEASTLDSIPSDDHTPGLKANRIQTQINALFDTPLMISGLLQEKSLNKSTGLPFFSSIPFFGPLLFAHQDKETEHKELIAILMPHASPPNIALDHFAGFKIPVPKGPLMLPRTWLSPSDERDLRKDPNFPWNVL